ncbi:hypothetical protein [Streptomyces sp. WMMB 322]|uniref:hypothetical protein n=1 Tax=Streptomyces sp. WMMB 322 TaxID=1286821 RepID=UPI0006E3D03A|nr:hypothetical protein [Streptomyces sp. WMMB 322]SCK59416.1 hypothetical protein H180DRAFT_05706 [Streptomyces sp. WMMB 322]
MSAREEWGWYAKHGARGIPGSAALSAELERIVRETGIKSPITTPRGLGARLHYLDSHAGRQALREAGVRPGTLRRWQQGKTKPSKNSREKIERAYREVRRHNMVRSGALTKRLQQAGRGTRVEIYPVNQTDVPAQRQRDVPQRSIRIRDWATITHAWAAGDDAQLDQAWGDIIADIASEYVAYAYVSGIGIGA